MTLGLIGHEVMPNTGAIVTKFSTLTTKTLKLFAKLATSEVIATNLKTLWITVDV